MLPGSVLTLLAKLGDCGATELVSTTSEKTPLSDGLREGRDAPFPALLESSLYERPAVEIIHVCNI